MQPAIIQPGHGPGLPPPGWREQDGLWLPPRERVVVADCGGAMGGSCGVRRRSAIGPVVPTLPSGAAWQLDHWDPSTMRQSVGGASVANNDPVGIENDTRTSSGRNWQASSGQRPTYSSTAFGGRGGVVYGGSQRLTGATAAPPAGACWYVHTWQLSVVPGSACVVMTESNGSVSTITFLSAISSYRPITFGAGLTSTVPVGLVVTLDTGVHTLAWTYLATNPAVPGSPADPTSPLQYRAVLDNVDVTSSIVAGSGGAIDNNASNNCLGAYNTGGVSALTGSLYKSGRGDWGASIAELIQASAWGAY